MSDSSQSGGEREAYQATRGSYWRSLERRHKYVIFAVAAIALVGAVGALALSGTRTPVTSENEASATIRPAEETSETSVGAPPYEEPAPEVGGDAPAAPPAADPADVPVSPARVVAYRREGWLCVAGEDGTGERRVAVSASSAYALSPDGRTLAFVDGEPATLQLADVGSGAIAGLGPAEHERVAWTADSAAIIYAAPEGILMRKIANPKGATRVFSGPLIGIAADGSIVGMDADGTIAVWKAGTVRHVTVRGMTTLAVGGNQLFIAVEDPGTGETSITRTNLDGSRPTTLVSAMRASRAAVFGDLVPSRDGSWLVYTERSDDGYSRMFAVPGAGGSPTSLCVRRDCYPLGWTVDGSSVLFIEGNAIQHDPTALMRVDPDGGSRRLLVQGAGL